MIQNYSTKNDDTDSIPGWSLCVCWGSRRVFCGGGHTLRPRFCWTGCRDNLDSSSKKYPVMLKQLYNLTTCWTWFDHQVLSKDYIELFMWSLLFINIFHNTNTIPCSQCSPFQDVTPSLKCSSSIEPTILPSLYMWNPQLSSVLNSCHKSAAWSQEASRRCKCNDIREAESTIRRPPPVPSTQYYPPVPSAQCPVLSSLLRGGIPGTHHLAII